MYPASPLRPGPAFEFKDDSPEQPGQAPRAAGDFSRRFMTAFVAGRQADAVAQDSIALVQPDAELAKLTARLFMCLNGGHLQLQLQFSAEDIERWPPGTWEALDSAAEIHSLTLPITHESLSPRPGGPSAIDNGADRLRGLEHLSVWIAGQVDGRQAQAGAAGDLSLNITGCARLRQFQVNPIDRLVVSAGGLCTCHASTPIPAGVSSWVEQPDATGMTVRQSLVPALPSGNVAANLQSSHVSLQADLWGTPGAAKAAMDRGDTPAAAAILAALLASQSTELLRNCNQHLGVPAFDILQDLRQRNDPASLKALGVLRKGIADALAAGTLYGVPIVFPRTYARQALVTLRQQTLDWVTTESGAHASAQERSQLLSIDRGRPPRPGQLCHFSPTQFGKALVVQLKGADIAQGRQLHLLVDKGDRLYAVNLEMAARAKSFKVSLRLGGESVPRTFETMIALRNAHLADFLQNDPVSTNCEDLDPLGTTCTLLGWPPAEALGAPEKYGIGDTNKDLAANTWLAMQQGDAELSRKFAKHALDRLEAYGARPAIAADTLRLGLYAGLSSAMASGRADIAGPVLRAVVHADSGRICENDKEEIIAGVPCFEPEEERPSGIFHALMNGDVQVARFYAQVLARSTEKQLSYKCAHRLLDARTRPGIHEAGDPSFQPILHAVCANGAAESPALRARQYDAIHAYVAELACNPSRMSMESKGVIFGARVGDTSAAEIALHDNPCAAAAIACAILENASPRQRIRLLPMAGVDLDNIMDALARAPEEDAVAKKWGEQLKRAAFMAGISLGPEVPDPAADETPEEAAATEAEPPAATGMAPLASQALAIAPVERPSEQQAAPVQRAGAVAAKPRGRRARTQQRPAPAVNRPVAPKPDAALEGAIVLQVQKEMTKWLNEMRIIDPKFVDRQGNHRYVPPDYDHLHFGPGFLEYRNRGGGGTSLIEGGKLHMHKIEQYLAEPDLRPQIRIALEVIVSKVEVLMAKAAAR
jgi:hypothetical protein